VLGLWEGVGGVIEEQKKGLTSCGLGVAGSVLEGALAG